MITAVKGRIKGVPPNPVAILIAQAMIGYSVRVITRIIPMGDLEQKLDQVDVSRLKAAADIQLRLISKYLGDVKAIEISGAEGGDLVIQVKDFKNA